MISEGPCDTEDWSNDVENTKINYNLLYVTVEIQAKVSKYHYEITSIKVGFQPLILL